MSPKRTGVVDKEMREKVISSKERRVVDGLRLRLFLVCHVDVSIIAVAAPAADHKMKDRAPTVVAGYTIPEWSSS